MSNVVSKANAFVQDCQLLKKEISKVIVGQESSIDEIVISIFCQGHALLVGVPGLAKTLMVQSIAKSLGLTFNRIQFTPDLMPSDITGAEILNEKKEFQFIPGPVFANILLADEINRTPPKTQAALLEAMQEKSVTVGGKTIELDKPFFVLATQNPIEQEGTYPLPEAQLDRFMFNIKVGYPSQDEEYEIVKRTTGTQTAQVNQVLDKAKIMGYQALVRQVPVADNVLKYAVDLVRKTRPVKENEWASTYLSWGAGPRAAQFLVLAAKCHALMNGKYSPDIENIQAVATSVLRHRILTNYKAEAEGYTIESIVKKML